MVAKKQSPHDMYALAALSGLCANSYIMEGLTEAKSTEEYNRKWLADTAMKIADECIIRRDKGNKNA